MKRTFLHFALILILSLSFACKDNNAKAEETTTEETTEAASETRTEETKAETTSSDSGTPSFSNAKVQEYVDAYEAYIEEYRKAVESKDMTAFAALGQKGQELGTKAQEVSNGLSAGDAEKLNAYMLKKSEEIQELSKKLMQ